jgi:hypothetical protein
MSTVGTELGGTPLERVVVDVLAEEGEVYEDEIGGEVLQWMMMNSMYFRQEQSEMCSRFGKGAGG